MSRTNLWVSIGFTATVILSIVIVMLSNFGFNQPQQKKHVLDAYMNNVNYIEYNNQGKISSRMHFATMQHYAKINTFHFDKPSLVTYTQKNVPWHITADHGSGQPNKDTVHLWGHVLLQQPNKHSHPGTTITTSQLTYHPKTSIATTQQQVTIIKPGTVVKGKGMQANLKTGTLTLLSHSREFYNPQHSTGK